MKKKQNGPGLWTRDFTIITLGSVVSMFGNAMSGFAMSLLVLDYTSSTLYYAIYMIAFTLPQMVVPIFSGALLDRVSRKKTIYTLDFISAGIYAVTAVILATGFFSFPLFAIFVLIIGSIQSIYMIAYESFYPLLITEGNFQKAYSIASVLETMSAIMVPVSTWAYKMFGVSPLLGINAVCFFCAAVMETRIRTEEKYVETQKENISEKSSSKQMLRDIKEGFWYLAAEKGLLAVAIYFTFSSFTQGAINVIVLPFFKGNFNNGEYIYMLVYGMAVAGRAIGGFIHYRVRLPAEVRYGIALTVYIVTSVFDGIYLYMPIPVMMAMMLMGGLLGVTSYTIRVSATQSYVPDEKKGRFNGAFNMLNTVGCLSGELLAGALAVIIPPRSVISAFMGLCLIAAIVFIGGAKKHVSKIYNR